MQRHSRVIRGFQQNRAGTSTASQKITHNHSLAYTCAANIHHGPGHSAQRVRESSSPTVFPHDRPTRARPRRTMRATCKELIMKTKAAVAWKAGQPLSIETVDLAPP